MPTRAPSYDDLLTALHAQQSLLSQPLGSPAPGEIADQLVEAVAVGLDREAQAGQHVPTDLNVPADLDAPIDRGAMRLAVRHLAGLLESRAPGRSVELRVPPYAAVQCVAGPGHTRGNPPNTVEAQPAAFVLVCTGRLAFATAVADGRFRVRGDRADLSIYLPLVR